MTNQLGVAVALILSILIVNTSLLLAVVVGALPPDHVIAVELAPLIVTLAFRPYAVPPRLKITATV